MQEMHDKMMAPRRPMSQGIWIAAAALSMRQ
jgi:hypothetical protein